MSYRRFSVIGTPIAQPRPKVTVRGQHARAYVPAKHPVHYWRESIAVTARAAGCYVIEKPNPVAIRLQFWMPRPKSHMGTGRNAGRVKPSAPLHHLKVPDLDNLEKAAKDALSGVAWEDDSQVAVALCTKHYADPPGKPGLHAWIHELDPELELGRQAIVSRMLGLAS